MMSPEHQTAMREWMVACAIGRIFGMMQRSEHPGDVAEYERCRRIIMSLLGDNAAPNHLNPLPGWNFGRGSSGVIE